MRKFTGFTLIELMIIMIIIIMFVVMGVELLKFRKAGAAESQTLEHTLDLYNVSRIWNPNTHTLIILNTGIAPWTTSDDACVALKDFHIKAIIIPKPLDTNISEPKIQWEHQDNNQSPLPVGKIKTDCN